MSTTDTKEIVQLLSGFVDTPASSAGNMASSQVPNAIIFGNRATGDTASDIIPKSLLGKLPSAVLSEIVAGKLGKPEFTPSGNLELGASEHYEILIRLKDYLQHETYGPTPDQLHDIAADGTIRYVSRRYGS